MKKKRVPSALPKQKKAQAEIARLKYELENALETLRAIQSGEIDALVVASSSGDRIFALKSDDLPYRVLVETMNEGAATVSLDGTILYCNQKFAELVPTPLEKVIGTKVLKFIHRADQPSFTPAFQQATKGRSKVILRVVPASHSEASAIFSMSNVALETGHGVCVVATDLTEQKRLDEARADIERLNLEKVLREQFVATLSHDLRNPLTAMKASAQLIVRYPDQHERHQILGNKIIHSVERADKMIQDLLDANRVRAGEKLPLQISECDLRQTAEDTLSELTMTVGDRFLLEANKTVLGFWSCDQLRRVVENLATNAVKYGSPESPIKVVIKDSKDEVSLTVHNEGSPIPFEEQKKLFQPFNRSIAAINSGNQGWGLGLTLVRGVAEAHGGRVSVESDSKTGTRFAVVLPRDSRPFQSRG